MTSKEITDLLSIHQSELQGLVVKSDDAFEKQISYISSGALGLSFILVEKLIPDIIGSSLKILLFLGWVCLAGSLLINLLSHRIASKLHGQTITEIANYIKTSAGEDVIGPLYDGEVANKRRNVIGKYNQTSIWLLFGGICLIMSFTGFNLSGIKKEDEIKSRNIVIFGSNNQLNMPDSNNIPDLSKQNGNDLNKGLQGSPLPIVPAPNTDNNRGFEGSPAPQVPPVQKPEE